MVLPDPAHALRPANGSRRSLFLAAYREYGYMVDYVNPGLNERGADLTWTKQYASRIRTDASECARM